MIKTENLYAEVVINESPYFYDEYGRLRLHVLEEGQLIPMLQPPKVKDDEESKLRAEFEKEDEGTMYNDRAYKNPADHPKEKKYQKWKEERKNKQEGGLTPMPEKKPEAIPEIPNQKPPAIKPGTGQPIRGGIDQRIVTKKPLTPEERAAKKEKIQRALADWKAKNPEKAAEFDKRSKERIQKRQVELQNLKKTDPEGYKARIDKAIEKMKARNPEKFAKREKAEMPAAGDRLAKADRG